MQQGEELQLDPNALLCFIDDSGHEEFAGHAVYGLGGCAVMGRDYPRLIINPWKDRRAVTAGNREVPLHASVFGRTATKSNQRNMARFFRRNAFMRFAAMASYKSSFPESLPPMKAVLDTLKNRIVVLVNECDCTSVVLLFEASQRVDQKIRENFALDLTDGAQELPVLHSFMPKSANEPGMEVADFVMHAVGRFGRHLLEAKPGFPRDFSAVFHSVDRRLTSFVFIDSVVANAPGSSEGFMVGGALHPNESERQIFRPRPEALSSSRAS